VWCVVCLAIEKGTILFSCLRLFDNNIILKIIMLTIILYCTFLGINYYYYRCANEKKNLSAINIFYLYIPLTLYPEGVAEVSQIFLRDIYVLQKLVTYEEHWRRDRW
jgi:hypothetical protein